MQNIYSTLIKTNLEILHILPKGPKLNTKLIIIKQ